MNIENKKVKKKGNMICLFFEKKICANWSKLTFYISCSFCIISFPFEMVIFFFFFFGVRSFYNFVFIYNMRIKLSRVIIQMKTIITSKEKRERERVSMINTLIQESLHISIKRFTRAMTCVMLLLLDCILQKEIKQKKFGDSPWIIKRIYV